MLCFCLFICKYLANIFLPISKACLMLYTYIPIHLYIHVHIKSIVNMYKKENSGLLVCLFLHILICISYLYKYTAAWQASFSCHCLKVLLHFCSLSREVRGRQEQTGSYQTLSISVSHQKQNTFTQKRFYHFNRYRGSESHCDSVTKQVEEKQLQILNLCNRAACS